MKERIKSYFVFASVFYRIVMYLVIPVFFVGFAFWAGSIVGEAVLILAAVLLPTVEVISDSWMFGGIQTKDPAKLDYIKTSWKGSRIMKNALMVDMLRRFLFSAGILGICRLVIYAAGKGTETGLGLGEKEALLISGVWNIGGSRGLGIFLFLTGMVYFLSTLGTFLSRYGSMIWINMTIGSAAGTLVMLGLRLPHLSEHIFAYALFFGILGICISLLAVRTAMKKMEEGYYDN